MKGIISAAKHAALDKRGKGEDSQPLAKRLGQLWDVRDLCREVSIRHQPLDYRFIMREGFAQTHACFALDGPRSQGKPR